MSRKGLTMTLEAFDAHQARVGRGNAQKRAVGPTMKPQGPRKYRNEPAVIDGIRFDSQHEAEVWQYLSVLQRNEKISHLQRQVSFPLTVEGKKVQTYRADFVYWDRPQGYYGRQWVVADAKSAYTRSLNSWRRTRALFEACYGLPVVEL